MGSRKNYDYDESDSYLEPRDETGLTNLQKEDKKKQAVSLNSIYSYKPPTNGSGHLEIDFQKTRKLRLLYMRRFRLTPTKRYAKNFRIIKDENRIPVFRPRV